MSDYNSAGIPSGSTCSVFLITIIIVIIIIIIINFDITPASQTSNQ